jgi:hypothetical protein
MSIRLTNLAFFTFLGVVVGGLLSATNTNVEVAIGGGIGLLIGCLLNRKALPTIRCDDTPATDPLVE